jgi:hypothetical protein
MCSTPGRQQKKGPSFGRKGWSPGGVVIRIGSTRSMKLHAVRAYFIRHHNLLHHSKDSLQARFIPGFFERSFKPH